MNNKDDMALFINAGVHDDVKIELSVRPEQQYASITFGNERVTLDFHDPECLERLRDLADDAARQLRAANELTDPAACRMVSIFGDPSRGTGDDTASSVIAQHDGSRTASAHPDH